MDGKPIKIKTLRRAITDISLSSSLGKYITAKELRETSGIGHQQLKSWRGKGKVRAQKKGNIYYYSLEDIIKQSI